MADFSSTHPRTPSYFPACSSLVSCQLYCIHPLTSKCASSSLSPHSSCSPWLRPTGTRNVATGKLRLHKLKKVVATVRLCPAAIKQAGMVTMAVLSVVCSTTGCLASVQNSTWPSVSLFVKCGLCVILTLKNSHRCSRRAG